MGKEGKICRSECPSARALELIGDRWSLLLIRESVFMGRREYGDFLKMMEGISTNVLADRLGRLVNAGIFTKHPHPTNKRKAYFEITQKGFELLPVLMELSKWGEKYIEDSVAPPEIQGRFNRDRAEFMVVWKENVQQRTAEYLEDAIIPRDAKP